MKSGFSNPTAPSPKEKKMQSPWNYDCPQYDERSSCFVNAGTHYGVGFNQPVGRKGNPLTKVAALPWGQVNTMKVDEVPYRNEILDIDT